MIKFSADETGDMKKIYVYLEQGAKVKHTKTVHNENGELVNLDYDEFNMLIGVEIIA